MFKPTALESLTPDVIVLGAGPAASLASARLACAGYSVVLLGRIDARQRIEGTSKRVLELLSAEGVNCRAFSPPEQRQAQWGQMAAAPNVEYVVERRVLDQDLLAMAHENGVTIVETTVRRVREQHVETDAGVLTGGRIIEARGRRASVNDGSIRGPASVACAGFIEDIRTSLQGTRLLSTPAGWCWLASHDKQRLWAQICIDASAVNGGKASLNTAWKLFFSQPELSESQWRQLPPPGEIHTRACEFRLSAPELLEHRPCIGDAAVAFDPLSGHGLFWALSSALMLPPMLRALEDNKATLAKRFYRSRVTDTFWRQARIARDFHSLCPHWSQTPFWRSRRAWPDTLPAHATLTQPVMQRRVVVANGTLEETDVLMTPQEPDGVAYVMGLPIAPVLKQLSVLPLPARAEFDRLVPRLSRAQAGSLHDWLVSRGLAVASQLTTSPLAETQP